MDKRKKRDELNQLYNIGKTVGENEKKDDTARGSGIRLGNVHVQTKSRKSERSQQEIIAG